MAGSDGQRHRNCRSTPQTRRHQVRLVGGIDRISKSGPIELVAHIPAQTENSIQPQEPQNIEIHDELPEPAVSELSANELVERIEAATELVNEFEQRQRLGIESLQAAIQQRGRTALTVLR